MPEYFRLGFGVSEVGFATALERIAEVLKLRKIKPLVAVR
jgi:hypothetical protein